MGNTPSPIQEKSTSVDPAQNGDQVQSSQAVTPEITKPTAKEKYGHQWLYRVSTLPPAVYTGAIDRLVRGDTLTSVARWVMAQPDRGGMQRVGEWTMIKYLDVLADEVAKQKRLYPAPAKTQLKAAVVRENIAMQREAGQPLPIGVALPRRGVRHRTLEQYLGDLVKSFNRNVYLIALCHNIWDALERMAPPEEAMAEAGVPVHTLQPGRAVLIQRGIEAVKELRENDPEYQRRGHGGMPGEFATIFAQELSEQEKRMQERLRGLPADQRALVLSAWEKLNALAKLRQDELATETASTGGSPVFSSEDEDASVEVPLGSDCAATLVPRSVCRCSDCAEERASVKIPPAQATRNRE